MPCYVTPGTAPLCYNLPALNNLPAKANAAPPITYTPPANGSLPAEVAELVHDHAGFSGVEQRYLIALAGNPYQTAKDASVKAGVSPDQVYSRRQHHAAFKACEVAIRGDPEIAANFLLRVSQPLSVAAWRENLDKGSRSATDAATAIMRETRERGDSGSRNRLADALARMAEQKADST